MHYVYFKSLIFFSNNLIFRYRYFFNFESSNHIHLLSILVHYLIFQLGLPIKLPAAFLPVWSGGCMLSAIVGNARVLSYGSFPWEIVEMVLWES